jgi:hypothetical protein
MHGASDADGRWQMADGRWQKCAGMREESDTDKVALKEIE